MIPAVIILFDCVPFTSFNQVILPIILLIALGYYGIVLTAFCGIVMLRKREKLKVLKHPSADQPPDLLPFIFLIIAVRNEAENITECLKTIAGQDYPADRFVVVVSDDHSQDDTVPRAKHIFQEHPGIQWMLVEADPQDQFPGGKKGAIERALAVIEMNLKNDQQNPLHEIPNLPSSPDSTSRSIPYNPLIVTTDGDTRRGSHWLSLLGKAYQKEKVPMILGPVMFVRGRTIMERLAFMENLGLQGITSGFAAIKQPVMANGANLAYSKKLFDEVSGFSGNIQYASGDDQFFLDKVVQSKGGNAVSFLFNPDAVVEVKAETSLGSFFAQRVRWIKKSRGYTRGLVLMIGAVTYLFLLSLLFLLVFGLAEPLCFVFGGVLFGIKCLVDISVVNSMARFFRITGWMKWFLPAQLFQGIYTLVLPILALFYPVRWKGRKI